MYLIIGHNSNIVNLSNGDDEVLSWSFVGGDDVLGFSLRAIFSGRR
jgi:hypothetical protein